MQQYPFIFSNQRKYRLQRHLVFWISWWVFCSVLYSFSAFASRLTYVERLPFSTIDAFFFLAPHIFLAYSLMYWVVPGFLLKGHYVQTLLAVIFVILITAVISALIGVYVLGFVRPLVLGPAYQPPPLINNLSFFIALLAGLRGAITIGGMAAAIKLMKYWYVKEQTNLQLQKENVAAQLQVLKAQVHPHFLFNTLNNIYSYTQNTSAVASALVMGLSDMLRYMLYECNQPLVPLHKEIKMLKDYVVLEQIRYNSQLDINMDLPEHTEGLYIAPLLLLPFAENCFKHGASQMLEHPWMSLTISMEGRQMKMKLMNGKAGGIEKTASGIGITNVQKRLTLLYPDQHQLKITDAGDAFIVDLKLYLKRMALSKETAEPVAVYE